jgi:SAM-dependent methyltransferase
MISFFKRILAFFVSTKQNDLLLKLLLLLLVLFFLVSYHNRKYSHKKEGFIQNQPYVLKRNVDAYDEFYAPVYEYIYHIPQSTKKEIHQVLQTVDADPKHSVFLDIGSGTGLAVSELEKKGYIAYGLDKSEEMVKYTKSKQPDARVKCGDAMDVMSFDPHSFTHILCLHHTIYSFRDKHAFFYNCARWLVPGGYLILHLVQPQKYRTIPPSGRPELLDDPQKYSKTRITDTAIDFHDFQYKSTYDFSKLQNRPGDIKEVVFMETFTDAKSGHIRQNEHTLYMEEEDVILSMGQKHGFVAKGQFDFKQINGDPHQHIYILYRERV